MPLANGRRMDPPTEPRQFKCHVHGIKAHGMNRRAIAVMAEAGVDISGHESTRITPAMLEQAYIVINVCGQRRQALS